jgi:hypothetical protein
VTHIHQAFIDGNQRRVILVLNHDVKDGAAHRDDRRRREDAIPVWLVAELVDVNFDPSQPEIDAFYTGRRSRCNTSL